MAGNFSIRIKSSEFQNIRKQFDRLVERTQNKVIKQAVKESMNPVVKEMRRRVPVDSGLLKKAITYRTKAYQRNGIIYGIAGIQSKGAKVSGRFRDPRNYAHLVEYGSSDHGVKYKKVMAIKGQFIFGKRVKGVRARPFVRPAWDANKVSMERNVREKLAQGIKKIAQGL